MWMIHPLIALLVSAPVSNAFGQTRSHFNDHHGRSIMTVSTQRPRPPVEILTFASRELAIERGRERYKRR